MKGNIQTPTKNQENVRPSNFFTPERLIQKKFKTPSAPHRGRKLTSKTKETLKAEERSDWQALESGNFFVLPIHNAKERRKVLRASGQLINTDLPRPQPLGSSAKCGA